MSVFIIIGIVVYNYVYQEHRNIESESPEFTMTALDIGQRFTDNVQKAEQQFLNKTIAVTGKISDKEMQSITIDAQVFCQFIHPISIRQELEETIKIKGRVIGYDELLEQVKLDQCTIIKIE